MTTPSTASDTMKSIGIVQEGAPVLTELTRPFELPREAAEAREIVAALHAAADRAATVHTFSKGMGVAAPQIGVGRRVAIVRLGRGRCHYSPEPRGGRGIVRHRCAVRGLPVVLRCPRQGSPPAHAAGTASGLRRAMSDDDLHGWARPAGRARSRSPGRGALYRADGSRQQHDLAGRVQGHRDRTGGTARAPGRRPEQPWQRQAGHLRVPQVLSAVGDVQSERLWTKLPARTQPPSNGVRVAAEPVCPWPPHQAPA